VNQVRCKMLTCSSH